MNFKDKIVWITGASSGIGEALTYAFISQGAKVIISARREEELKRVKASCKTNTENCFIYQLDVANQEQINSIAKIVLADFSRIDILILNAGIGQRSLVRETQLSVDRQIMEVDYFGVIALTKAVLPSMIANGGGHFVVTSSLMGRFGFTNRSAYAAAKHALFGFFESLRCEETKNNIRITMLVPGWVKTNISYNALTKDGDKHNALDKGQEQGISPDVAARKILKAIGRNKKEVVMGGKELVMLYLHRYCRPLYYWLSTKVKST